MKQTLYKSTLLLAVFFMVNTVVANGFFEQKKEYRFAYKVNDKPSVEINNEYGEITVVTWEKDSIKIDATIIASSDKMDDMEKLLEKIEVSCRGSESMVVATTEWTEGFNFLKRGAMDLKNILKSDKKLTVNYKVYLPKNCKLSINNRFGDIYLPDYFGPLRIDLSHGDLRARKIEDGRSIMVKYGKAIIKTLDAGLLKVEYGNLILDRSNYLTLESKSSTIEILEVKALSIESRNDELRIDKVESLRGQATFSHTLVRQAEKMVNLSTNYGDLMVKKVSQDFDLIRLTGTNTDYDIEFSESSTFQFSVSTFKEKGFVFSPAPTSMKEEVVDKDDKIYKGYYGNENSESKVNISLKNGYINWFMR